MTSESKKRTEVPAPKRHLPATSPAGRDLRMGALAGKVAIVTGAISGIG
jgi:hypothetical protein